MERILWVESLPIGTRIKNWTIKGALSAGTFSSFYVACKKEEHVIIKVVKNFSCCSYVREVNEIMKKPTNLNFRHQSHSGLLSMKQNFL